MSGYARGMMTLALWLLAGLAHAGTHHHYYTDPQGTVLAKTDAQGNVIATYDYAPYGQAVASMSGAPDGPGYTGHVNDPGTGLVYMQARYYDPNRPGFLSVDPVGPTPGNLFSSNRYDYANNNPIGNIDPDGRQTLPPSVYQTDWSNPETRRVFVDVAVGVTPVVSDAQNISDAISNPSISSVSIAAIGAIPEVGGLLSKAVKEARAVTKIERVAGDVAREGNLPKPPRGPGSVPKAERDPRRFFKPSEREAKRAEQGHECANGCGTRIDDSNSAGHHIERHADGGYTNSENHAEVCIPCHQDLHSGN